MSSISFAARVGKVNAYGAELRDGPYTKSNLIKKLAPKTPLVASNFPTEGYHKVRLPGGTVGWVSAQALVLDPLPKRYAPQGQGADTEDETDDGEIPPPPASEK